jgi:hypothetical protein
MISLIIFLSQCHWGEAPLKPMPLALVEQLSGMICGCSPREMSVSCYQKHIKLDESFEPAAQLPSFNPATGSIFYLLWITSVQ